MDIKPCPIKNRTRLCRYGSWAYGALLALGWQLLTVEHDDNGLVVRALMLAPEHIHDREESWT